MSLDLKVCPFCITEISKEAIKCPQCQEWLNRKEFSIKNPIIRIGLTVFLIFGLGMFVPRYFLAKSFQKLHKQPIGYTTDAKLRVLSHRIVKNKNNFSILGEIENKEKFKWATVTVQVTFRDQSNAISSLGKGYINNLMAESKKPFEVTFGCLDEAYDPKRHASYTIEIDEAQGELGANND